METGVLFVCTGNICRSPTAEGVFRKMVAQAGLDSYVRIASAGTHAYHLGDPPDPRTVLAARKRGYDLSRLRAHAVDRDDLRDNDLVLVMDWDNLAELQKICPTGHQHKLQLLMRFALESDAATVPDPYYGGPQDFDFALDCIEDACIGLVEVVRRRSNLVAAA